MSILDKTEIGKFARVNLALSKDRLNKMSKASLSLSLPNAVNKISKEAISLINNV